MIDMPELIRRFELHEGISLMPYRCPAGKLTIGIGHNLDAHPLTAEEICVLGDWQHGITRNSALYLLRRDILRCRRLCRQNISFWDRLDSERQYALTDMCFNLGLSGLLKFKKMLEALEKCDYRLASKECLNSKYAQDVGKRARRIAHVMETGVFNYD